MKLFLEQSRKVMGWTSYGFKSEEDTMKNEIFLRLYIAPPPRLRKNIYLPNVLKSSTNY